MQNYIFYSFCLTTSVLSHFYLWCKLLFFFYLDFLSQTFPNQRTAGEGRGHFFNSSLTLPPASQTLRHQPGDYCRELTSSQQPDLNWEPLVSERKSLALTTKPRTTNICLKLSALIILHLKNETTLFTLKTLFEETKRWLSFQMYSLTRNLELIGFDGYKRNIF